VGFEPTNNGFADRALRPLGHLTIKLDLDVPASGYGPLTLGDPAGFRTVSRAASRSRAGDGNRTREYLVGNQVPYRLATPAFELN
jgi:hypothetical protein